MKRFAVTMLNNIVFKLYYPDIETARINNPDAVNIEEISSTEHLPYCKRMIDNGTLLRRERCSHRTEREVYMLDTSQGRAYVKLCKDNTDDTYYDICYCQIHDTTSYVLPVMWDISTPREFCNKYMYIPFKFEIVNARVYGQPKLAKPKELKGIKASGTVSWLGKVACQWFIKGDDVYTKHRDYFSQSLHKPEDIGTPLEYRLKKYGIKPNAKSKFIYNDCWGEIVLRNEAWIRLNNVVPLLQNAKIPIRVANNIVEQQKQLHGFSQIDPEWARFWEQLCNDIANKVR